ncbi:hypothetical protein GGX14DRAFT_384272 [Mycena pura]|uniref:Uncharacterized protein n=1 Tax=Mycena pura TaxID=153505 RepID=A0AAD6YV06_9AGAR|nr:hypothetical protein GGX14DRAFT_384272 [Mycena pura]
MPEMWYTPANVNRRMTDKWGAASVHRQWRCILDLIGTLDSTPAKQICQEAARSVLDSIPLCAIASAHKREADALYSQGSPDAHTIYMSYCKYLLLYPFTQEEEYRSVLKKTYILERAINGQ